MGERTVTRMLSPAECRKRAAECELLAGKARTPERRDELLALARKWVELAQGTEQVDPAPSGRNIRPPTLKPGIGNKSTRSRANEAEWRS
jgi:hypothetical protein